MPPTDQPSDQSASACPNGTDGDRSDSDTPAELLDASIDNFPTLGCGQTASVISAQIVRMRLTFRRQTINPHLRILVLVAQRCSCVLRTTRFGAKAKHVTTVGHDVPRTADASILGLWTTFLRHLPLPLGVAARADRTRPALINRAAIIAEIQASIHQTVKMAKKTSLNGGAGFRGLRSVSFSLRSSCRAC